MNFQILVRIAAWTALIGIEVLSVVPANKRPVVGPQGIEHIVAFGVLGFLFALGYRLAPATTVMLGVGLSAAIELSQMLAPGRHARLTDFAIDAASICAGAILGLITRRVVPAL